MHLPQLACGIAALHTAALAFARPWAPQQGAYMHSEGHRGPLQSNMARALAGVRAAGIPVALASSPIAQKRTRLPSTSSRRSRQTPPSRAEQGEHGGKGTHPRAVLWLPQTSPFYPRTRKESAGPPPAPPMLACRSSLAQPTVLAVPPADPDPLDILVDALASTHGGAADRNQVAREVGVAQLELAWICGGQVDAERRQQEWKALSDPARKILCQLELLHTVWSPLTGAPVTGTEREIALAAVTEDRDVSAFSIDEICRFGWMRGVKALVVPFQDSRALQTPLDFLRAVYALTNTPMALAIDPGSTLRGDIDPQRLEAARLLYELARDPGYAFGETRGLVAAQQGFRQALADDLGQQRRSIEFVPDTAPTYEKTGLWHDGFAIRGASGMDASMIAAQASSKGVPLEEARRLVDRRMWDKREGTRYLIGTPQQAMETVLLRLGPQFGIAADGLDDVGCLLAHFQLLEDRLKASGNYPLGATLLAARYCARASGVLDSSKLDEETLLAREVRTMLSAGPPAWREHPAGENPALTFEWRHLPAMARADHRLTHSTFEIAATRLYRHLQETREIIAKPEMSEVNLALLDWYRDRMLAYRPIPVFDAGEPGANLDTVAARRLFNAALATTPAMQARAREHLRMTQQPLTEPNIKQAADNLTQDALGGSAIDYLPFLGPAYQIEQGMWHKSWHEGGMGVARLGADILFVWVGGLAARETAETVETVASALNDYERELFEPPAVSMLKDYQRDAHALGDGVEPRGTGGYAEVGEAESHELNYSEEGAGQDDEGMPFPPRPRQFTDTALSAESPTLRRTVEDCKSFFLGMKEIEQAGTRCGLSGCLPAIASGASSSGIGDLFVSRIPAMQMRINEVESTFGASPSFRRLGGYARSAKEKMPFAVSDSGRWSPRTTLQHRQIHMQDDAALEAKSFMGFRGPEPFVPLEVWQHELVHGLTFLEDNAGKSPWLHRGPVLPICDQISYESNTFFPQRIAYQRYFSAEESPARHEQALLAHAGVRAATLKENVELDALFAGLNLKWPGYTILGTPANSRVTVAQAPRLVSAVQAIFGRRPKTIMPVRYFADYFKTRGGRDSLALAAQSQLVQLLTSLCNRSELFLGTAERWLLDSAENPWKFIFGEPYWPGDSLQAWRVDRETRTVHFNSRPMHYLSRGGPEKLTPARAIVGYFVEEVYGKGKALSSCDPSLNRGPSILLENLIFEEIGKIGQRVSAELSITPDLLWDKVVFASKAASDEDLRLQAQLSKLDTRALVRIRTGKK